MDALSAVLFVTYLDPVTSKEIEYNKVVQCLSIAEALLYHRGVIKEEDELREMGDTLRCLVTAKALLHTVFSVPGSVISSLLLLSGDTEENPGPGHGGIARVRYSYIYTSTLHNLYFVNADVDFDSVDTHTILGKHNHEEL